MLVIVEYESNIQNKVSNLLGYTPVIYTFEDMFSKYTNSTKKKYLATEEIFSLSYDTTLSDLKRSVWISINDNELPIITKKLKVLEICN